MCSAYRGHVSGTVAGETWRHGLLDGAETCSRAKRRPAAGRTIAAPQTVVYSASRQSSKLNPGDTTQLTTTSTSPMGRAACHTPAGTVCSST